jgi:hypothetical protein
MKNAIKHWTLGVLLCLALASCRKDKPPVIEICILDGLGGADCVEHDGSKVYRAPSELRNYVGTNPEDQAEFAAWCYNVKPTASP